MTLDHANEMIAQCLRDGRERDYSSLADMADVMADAPTDAEMLYVLAEAFDMSLVDMADRLAKTDVAALREVVTP